MCTISKVMCERTNIDFPCHSAADYVFLLAQLNPSSFSVYAIPIDLCEHKSSKHVKTECHHQQISSHATILTLQTKSDEFSSRKITLLTRKSFCDFQHFFHVNIFHITHLNQRKKTIEKRWTLQKDIQVICKNILTVGGARSRIL